MSKIHDMSSFGYRDVPSEVKTRLVRSVFDSVAPHYDVMNDLMSGGLHRLWKDALINWLRPSPAMTLLDVAGGTGDIARRFKHAGGGNVTVCDINESMLKIGRDRALNLGMIEGFDWCIGNAEQLPFEDLSTDSYSVAFGLRNVTRLEVALSEARRVLKPGGHLLCLEFSHVTLPWLARLYEKYSFSVLPFLGSWVAKDAESYRYLAESIRRFPTQPELARMMQDAGFAGITWRNLSSGIVALHSAWRI